MNLLKRILGRPAPAPIVVSSIGRSGSTLTFKAIKAVCSNPKGCGFAETLSDYPMQKGAVYKTHDFPAGLQGRGARAVFLFSSASDSAKSVYGCRNSKGAKWIADHLRHLKSDGNIDDIFDADILRIGEQIDAWTTCTHTPVLALRYETLWDNLEGLRAFTGLPVALPEKHLRPPKALPDDLESRCQTTYAALDTRVAKLPDCFVVGE